MVIVSKNGILKTTGLFYVLFSSVQGISDTGCGQVAVNHCDPYSEYQLMNLSDARMPLSVYETDEHGQKKKRQIILDYNESTCLTGMQNLLLSYPPMKDITQDYPQSIARGGCCEAYDYSGPEMMVLTSCFPPAYPDCRRDDLSYTINDWMFPITLRSGNEPPLTLGRGEGVCVTYAESLSVQLSHPPQEVIVTRELGAVSDKYCWIVPTDGQDLDVHLACHPTKKFAAVP